MQERIGRIILDKTYFVAPWGKPAVDAWLQDRVNSKGGSIIIININKRQPVAANLIGLFEEFENALSDKALMGLQLTRCAWAGLEDETQNTQLKQRYVDFRDSWGWMARDSFSVAYDD